MPARLAQTVLLSQLTGDQWRKGSFETASQRFFAEYAKTVDNYGFTSGSGSRFYGKDVVFHNQNNVDYHGSDQMWSWMKQIFGQFEHLRHDIHWAWDIEQTNGESKLIVQMTRNIWIKGSHAKEPEVSAPAMFICTIGPADHPDAFEGLQFKEVWLYWDTMLLAPHMGKDAVAFSRTNVAE